MSTEATTADSGVVEPTISEEVSAPEVNEEVSEELTEEPAGDQPEVEENAESSDIGEENTPENSDKYEVTVDGEKLLLTRDELMRGFQLGAASHKRFQEAAKARKEAEAALTKIKENPFEAFLEAGGDQNAFRAIAEDFLLKQIEYDKMSPEEKELSELRRYKEEQEVLRQQEASRKQEEIRQKQIEQDRLQLEQEYKIALEAQGLPASPKVMGAIANIQLAAREAGYDLPLDMAISQYQEDHSNNINSYLSSLDPEQLVEVIGKDRMKEIRKRELAGLKNPVSRKKSSSEPVEAPEKKLTASEFFANL